MVKIIPTTNDQNVAIVPKKTEKSSFWKKALVICTIALTVFGILLDGHANFQEIKVVNVSRNAIPPTFENYAGLQTAQLPETSLLKKENQISAESWVNSLMKDFDSSDRQSASQAAIDLLAFNKEPISINFKKSTSWPILKGMIDLLIKSNWAASEEEAINKLNVRLNRGACHGTSLGVIKFFSLPAASFDARTFYYETLFLQILSQYESEIFHECNKNIQSKIKDYESRNASSEIEEQKALISANRQFWDDIHSVHFQIPNYKWTINQDVICYKKNASLRISEFSTECGSKAEFIRLFKEKFADENVHFSEIGIHPSDGSESHSISLSLHSSYFFQDTNIPDSISVPTSTDEYSPLNIWNNYSCREECIGKSAEWIFDHYIKNNGYIEIIGYGPKALDS